jgi:hypothetical protein
MAPGLEFLPYSTADAAGYGLCSLFSGWAGCGAPFLDMSCCGCCRHRGGKSAACIQLVGGRCKPAVQRRCHKACGWHVPLIVTCIG